MRTERHTAHDYIPALGLRALTPLYDPVLRWLLREEQFKQRLIAGARIAPSDRVLDLGCGTGTLTVMIATAHPNATVTGLDVDAQVLAIARAKATRVGARFTLVEGMADELPFASDTFDRVLSSLVIHHLTTGQKRRALQEVQRVLRPGGEVHIVDFGPPHTRGAALVATAIRHLEHADDNIAGAIPEMLRAAGFADVVVRESFMTLVGPLARYQGRKRSR